MKRLFALFLCALFVWPLATLPVTAQQTEERKGTIRVKMAVIDIEAIRREAAAVKEIRAQFKQYDKALQADVQKEDQELRNAQQALTRQRAILSPDAFAEERRTFEQRVVKLQRAVQGRKRELDRALNDAMFKVQKALNKVVVELAQEHGFTLLLRKDQTVLVAKPLEITDLVLQRLNEQLPSVQVSEPGN